MKEKFTILIADRNAHVRGYLKREMMAEGYRIRLAENGREILRWAYHPEPLDLIIFDPDMPDIDEASLFKKLQDRIPTLPVVIHSFPSSYAGGSAENARAVFVEKRGNSIEKLKKVVNDILLSSSSAK